MPSNCCWYDLNYDNFRILFFLRGTAFHINAINPCLNHSGQIAKVSPRRKHLSPRLSFMLSRKFIIQILACWLTAALAGWGKLGRSLMLLPLIIANPIAWIPLTTKRKFGNGFEYCCGSPTESVTPHANKATSYQCSVNWSMHHHSRVSSIIESIIRSAPYHQGFVPTFATTMTFLSKVYVFVCLYCQGN